MLGAERLGHFVLCVSSQSNRRKFMKWNQSSADPAPEPSEAPEAGGNPKESLEQLIQSAVAEGSSELRKELAPPRRITRPQKSQTFPDPPTATHSTSPPPSA